MDTSIWSYVAGANRWALYAFMLLAAGSALFALTMRLPPAVTEAATRLGKFSALLAAVAYGLAVVLGGADMINGGLEILIAPSTWALGFDSSLGRSAIVGVPAMILLIAGFRVGSRWLLGAGITLAIVSFLVTGHAATAEPVWLMSAAVGVHLACAAFWLGALYPLYRGTRLPSVPDAGALMVAFSHSAVWTTGALVFTGVIISVVQIERLNALVTTAYGWRLLVKVSLFGLLLLIAAYNKLFLTPQLSAGQTVGAQRLRGTIRLEFLLFAFILVAAASLTLTAPPRTLAPGMTRNVGALKQPSYAIVRGMSFGSRELL